MIHLQVDRIIKNNLWVYLKIERNIAIVFYQVFNCRLLSKIRYHRLNCLLIWSEVATHNIVTSKLRYLRISRNFQLLAVSNQNIIVISFPFSDMTVFIIVRNCFRTVVLAMPHYLSQLERLSRLNWITLYGYRIRRVWFYGTT